MSKKQNASGPTSSKPENRQTRKFSYIYSAFVNNKPDDIVGLVAYGLYKKDKVEFIKEHVKTHGKDPSEDELCIFHAGSTQKIRVYIEEAEDLVAKVHTAVNGQYLKQVEKKFQEELKERLKGTFKWNVFASVVGSFVTAIVTVILYVVLVRFPVSWTRLGADVLKRLDEPSAKNDVAQPKQSKTNMQQEQPAEPKE